VKPERKEDSGLFHLPTLDRMTKFANDAALLAARQVMLETEPRRAPYDRDDEYQLIACVASGSVRVDQLPTKSNHFAIPLCATIYAAFADGADLAGAQARLVDEGYPIEAIRQLHLCVDTHPILPEARVIGLAMRVVELWRQRKIADVCHRVSVLISAEAISSDEAIGMLRAAVLEVRS